MKYLHNIKKKIQKKTQLKPPNDSEFETIIFRNDDVSYDTNLEHFKEFCSVFHRYGFVQLQGITLYGKMNYTYLVDGKPLMYNTISGEDFHNYEICKSVSVDFIGDNKELIKYINSIPDPIALHGLYHSDYARMTYEQQDHDIFEGLNLLHQLFPYKNIDTFIAPFNHTNEDTFKVCQKYNLRVSGQEGLHLEELIHLDKGPIFEGELYRYHHHRFYPESTFFYYDLSIDKLSKYLEKYSYTKAKKMEKAVPSLGLLSTCLHNYNAKEWYIYANKESNLGKHTYSIERYIKKHIEKTKSILQVECGAGGMLFRLRSACFKNLYGYDCDEKVVRAAQEINKTIDAGITFYTDDIRNVKVKDKYDVVVWTSGMYHLDGYSLVNFLSSHIGLVNNDGYIIFDVVNKSVDHVPNNQILNQNWDKPEDKRKQSEYKNRMTYNEVDELVRKYHSRIIHHETIQEAIPRDVFVLKYRKPRICFYCDRPGWAHDFSAQELKKYLSNDFNIDIKYVVSNEDIDAREYDAILVFFWGETSYKKYGFPKRKIIKQVSSHRWQFDKPYGPMSVTQFYKKYLSDAATVICPSKILFDTLTPVVKNLFLCGKGASPEVFEYHQLIRTEGLSICMVGNIDDPVKGVYDILVPSAEGYTLDFCKNLSRDELCNFYNSHDVYAMTSKHEADPLPLIESMMCGCFPVAHKVGIAPELIRHKENGFLVSSYGVEDFKSAFDWCNKNIEYIREKRKDISEEMREKRNWDLMANSYRNMLWNHLERC